MIGACIRKHMFKIIRRCFSQCMALWSRMQFKPIRWNTMQLGIRDHRLKWALNFRNSPNLLLKQGLRLLTCKPLRIKQINKQNNKEKDKLFQQLSEIFLVKSMTQLYPMIHTIQKTIRGCTITMQSLKGLILQN